MSMRTAETRKALFDRMEGRGDVMSIPVEKGAELAALPKEMFADIFYPLFQWWVYGKDTEPSDPRDKMVFTGLKTHQIENSVRRGTSLKNWIDNGKKGGRPKGDKKPSGNQKETKCKPSGYSNVDRVQDEEQDKSSSSLSTLSTGEGSPQGVIPPAAPLPSIEEAQQWLEVHAPQYTSNSELYNDDERRTPKECWPDEYLRVDAREAAKMIADKKLPQLPPNFLRLLNDRIAKVDEGEVTIDGFKVSHDDTLKRVMLRAFCEDIPDKDDRDEQNEAGQRIIQAVRDCATMLDVILASGNDTSEDY